jgi:hypothetical protein
LRKAEEMIVIHVPLVLRDAGIMDPSSLLVECCHLPTVVIF